MVSSSEEWVIRGTIESDLFPELTFTPIMKTLMKLRGLRDPGEVIDYLYPSLGNLRDPRDMRGMLPACERTACAIEKGETIGVFTDYDVDGVCSAALLHRFFLRIGAPSPVVFIPDRTRDGYGLNARGIAALHAQGVSLLITADCGSNAYDEVEQAKELGIDVIITDHHEPGQHLPRALALINPKQPGCPFGDEDLCGAGVVFHFIVALRAVLRERGWKELPNLRQDLDLVAMATVADVVALSGINRILVKEGLAVLNTSEGVGLPVLARVAGIHHEVYAKDIGFILGPRINAAGRVASAERALDLLITEDERTAYGIANELHLLNRRRQATEQRVLREALAMIGEGDHTGSVIVAAGTDWHLGVIGIVASRLASLFDRPAIVITITDGVGKGSGRSVAGIDLHAALSEVSAHLLAFGGHKMAVGLSIEASRIPAFASALGAVVGRMRPRRALGVAVDLKISALDLTPALLTDLEILAPFGEGNPEPVFMIPSMEVVSTRKLSASQIKLILTHSGRVFHTLGCSARPGLNQLPRYVDVAFTPVRKRINGQSYLYLDLRAVSPAGRIPVPGPAET